MELKDFINLSPVCIAKPYVHTFVSCQIRKFDAYDDFDNFFDIHIFFRRYLPGDDSVVSLISH